MKKQIFLVVALVAIAMSSMFVACSDKNAPTVSWCSCDVQLGDERWTMEYESEGGDDFQSCTEVARWFEKDFERNFPDREANVTCNGY